MKILLATYGSRGDVQPALALALKLRARGHVVRFLGPPNYAAWVGAFGFEYRAAGRDVNALLAEFSDHLRDVLPIMKADIGAEFQVTAELGEWADIIVGISVHAAGRSIAERRGIPYHYAVFSPSLLPSRHHPAPFVESQSRPRWLNRLSWWTHRRLWNLLFRRLFNREREKLGLAAVGDLWDHIIGREVIVAADAAIALAPRDAMRTVHQTGAWFLDEAERLPADVLSFLDAGSPPVYLGLGSLSSFDRVSSLRLFVEAVTQAGVRALVHSPEPDADRDAVSPPPTVKLVGVLPHAQLFPRTMGVVHHGGAGTTHAAVRAGVPQVIVPHFLDQFFWAKRVEELALSAGTLPRKGLRAADLSVCLGRLQADSALRAGARAFAALICTDGCDRAVAIIERNAAER